MFSCFHCGGGSTLGYKLAGCSVLGGVEIDPKMMRVYRANFRPSISIMSDVRVATPPPGAQIDILDGSPPCTPFSTAGKRENSWGKLKRYSEGATEQTLDDLFFAFLDFAARMSPRPRAIIAENVSGILGGNARAYVQKIVARLKQLGYTVQLFNLTAANFGVPQTRPRVFFVAHQSKRRVRLEQTPGQVTVRSALADIDPRGRELPAFLRVHWAKTKLGGMLHFNSGFSRIKLNPDGVAPTLTTQSCWAHWESAHELSDRAYARIQSFPDDYDLCGQSATYVYGMSVAPFVMRALATALLDVM